MALADAAPATAPVAVAATAWVPRLDGEAGGAGGGVERTTVGPAGEPWPADGCTGAELAMDDDGGVGGATGAEAAETVGRMSEA
ncbi:hypothetical protein MSIM_47350 [Mycobacterium simiae]|nr:hypothetical protein MSIM_47350 [Mycobacterium simiae]